MKNINKKIFVILFCSFVFILIFKLTSKPAFIVLEEDLNFFKTIEASYRGNDIIYVGKKNESYIILSCIETKHGFVLKTKINNEITGYVNYGQYKMYNLSTCS